MNVHENMRATRTLVVDMLSLSPYANDLARFPGDNVRITQFTPQNGIPAEDRAWLLDGVDALYAVETYYAWSILEEARERGVRTTLHVNYELSGHATDPTIPRPDVMAFPTRWGMDACEGAVLLPMPVPSSGVVPRLRTSAGRFLHVGGHPAAGDRAGTQLVLESLQRVRQPITVEVRSQQSLRRNAYAGRVSRKVTLDLRGENAPDWWEPYDRADVLIAPRRYGALSLPLWEAMAAGLAVIATDRHPESAMLPAASLVPARNTARMRCVGGMVETTTAGTAALTQRIDQFAADDGLVRSLSEHSLAWADANSWTALRPTWEAVLFG